LKVFQLALPMLFVERLTQVFYLEHCSNYVPWWLPNATAVTYAMGNLARLDVSFYLASYLMLFCKTVNFARVEEGRMSPL
jgi:hypothetical protein